MRPIASLPDANGSASHLELVLIDVKQSKISLRLVGFVGKIKNKKINSVHVPEKVRDKDRERDHCQGCFLKPCRDQSHTVAPLAEAEESLNPDAVSVVLVSDLLIRLLLLFIFRATPQLRTRYTDAVLLTECDVCPRSVDLVNEYPFWPSAGTFMVFDECFLKLFGFIECFKGNPGHARIPMLIKDNLKLGPELCRCFDLASDDRPDPRLRKVFFARVNSQIAEAFP